MACFSEIAIDLVNEKNVNPVVSYSPVSALLVCEMPVCGHKIAIPQAETAPCVAHGEQADHPEQTAEVMFMLDCTGGDLSLIVHDTALKKVDFKSDDKPISNHELGWFKANTVLQTSARPTWDTRPKRLPNIILTTQRFRLETFFLTLTLCLLSGTAIFHTWKG